MEQPNELLYPTTAILTHHLWSLKEIAKGFQQIKEQDEVWKSTEYKPCFYLIPRSNTLTFHLTKSPCKKHATDPSPSKRQSFHLLLPNDITDWKPQGKNSQYLKQNWCLGHLPLLWHISRCSLSFQSITWLRKPSLLRWFLSLFTKEAAAVWALHLLAKPEQPTAKYVAKRKYHD